MKHVTCRFALFVCCFALLCVSSCAETPLPFCINEICSGNGGHFTIGGSAPDYIELYNLMDQEISLDGYFISDDEDHPGKYPLDGYTIPENNYIILAADKKELPFKLSAAGEELFLSDKEGNILQHVVLPPLEKDNTYSLQEEGEWQITEPTPLTVNQKGISYEAKAYVASPRFSHNAGFYDEPFDLTLESYRTYKVYYTTDGSIPDEKSRLYTGKIHITDATSSPNTLSMRTDITVTGAVPPAASLKKATVIRCVAVDAEGNRSNVVTNTYFVGYQNYQDYQDISVLSVVADPDALFDEDNGIYVVGKMYRDWLESDEYSSDRRAYDQPRNYGKHGREWEIPASVQYFDEHGRLHLSQNVGVRIHGNMTREDAQKSLNLYARKEYGEDTFQYRFFEGMDSLGKLVVRGQAGRDSIAHGLLRETGLPVTGCIPCLVFINGEFWGFYELREKQEEEYLADLFGIEKDSIMVYKNYALESGQDEKGHTDIRVYRDFVSSIVSNDLSTPEGYAYACEVMDIDNYITYMAAVLYCNNEDLKSNNTLWRTMSAGSSPYEDGRWRWIIQDMDTSIHRTDGVKEAISIAAGDELFMALWKNPVFRERFLTRIMDFANIELTPEYVREYITPILEYYKRYFVINDERWNGKTTGDRSISNQRISNIMSFFRKRKTDVIERLQTTLGVTEKVNTISIRKLPDDLQLFINGHEAYLHGDMWEGSYFSGGEVTVTVREIPGYRFAGWYQEDSLLSTEKTIVISTDASHTLTPVYEPIPVIAQIDLQQYLSFTKNTNTFSCTNYRSGVEAVLKVDDGFIADHSFVSESLVFTPRENWPAGMGFTVTFPELPLQDYENLGALIRYHNSRDSALNWRVFCGNSESSITEIKDYYLDVQDEETLLYISIPEAYKDGSSIVLRFESAKPTSREPFQLSEFRFFGERTTNPD